MAVDAAPPPTPDQAYIGVAPPVTVAVKVIKVFEHTFAEEGDILTLVGAVTPVTVVVAVAVKAGQPELETVTPYVLIPATARKVVVETVPLVPVPVHA